MDRTPRPTAERGRSTMEVEWTTISYRTIGIFVVVGLLLLGFVLYLIAPQYFGKKIDQVLSAFSSAPGPVVEASSTREAHFVNIDGTVRVKKAQSQQWIRADYNTALEKGDFVQTSSDGVARIVFTDGTNYVVKADSLIVVEESNEDPVTKATKVAVQVTSGAVDLSTGRFEGQGSVSQVSIENAVANLKEDSRAAIRNDPKHDLHEITVDQGQADVTRGSSTVRLGQYDQVSFSSAQAGMLRSRVIAPPALQQPPNMDLKLTNDPKTAPVAFAWHEVPGATAYHLLISPSGMFSNLAADKTVRGTSVQVSGLNEGTYYWVVSSIDAKGVESQPSEANRFNLVKEEEAGAKAFLEVTSTTLHGRVVEVVGRTEPSSTVIVNNMQVFSIARDGTFRHFTSPLRAGENQITITAQDRNGNTNTIRKTIVIE